MIALNEHGTRGRALVVDDDAVSRRLIGACLSSDGIAVDEVADVDAALRALVRNRYDVVLLDLFLGGGSSGLDVLRALRGGMVRGETPVILVSASGGDSRVIANALDEGADDCLRKPLRPLELRARVAAVRRRGSRISVLNRRSAELERVVQHCASTAEHAARSQRAALPVLPFASGPLAASGALVASESLSGDFFDLVRQPDGSVVALVADVAGHGAPAAMLATALAAAMRGPLLGGRGVEASAHAADAFLRACRSNLHPSAVASVAMVHVEPGRRTAHVLNAGMPAVCLAAPDGARTWLESEGRPLGLGPPRSYVLRRVTFAPGAWLAIASDGAVGGDQDVEASAALLARASASGPWLARAHPADVEALVREHLGIAATARPEDDATLLFVAHMPAEET